MKWGRGVGLAKEGKNVSKERQLRDVDGRRTMTDG